MKTTPILKGLTLLALALALAAPTAAFAQTLYWQGSTTGIGGGANNVINTTSANWNPQADGSGTIQTFAGSTSTNVVFAGTGGAVTFSNSLTSGDFTVNSANYVFGIGPAAGDIILTMSNFAGSALSSTVFQNNNTTTARQITITTTGDSAFTGTMQDGGAFALNVRKLGGGTLTMSGNNTFTGNFTIGAGALVLNTDSFSSSATMLISGSSTLRTTNAARTWSGKFGGVNSGQTFVIDGNQNLTFDSLNSATSFFASSASATINVNSSNSAVTRFGGTSIGISATASAANTVTIGGSGAVVVSANIVNGGASSTNSLELRNTGGVTLSGNNTFTGDLSVRSGGVLNVASLNNKGVAGVLGMSTNRVQLSLSGTTSTINWTGTSDASTDREFMLDNSGGTGTTSTATINANGTGKMTLGGITGGGSGVVNVSRNLNLAGSGSGGAAIGNIINGVTTGGATNTMTVNKSGTTTWSLTGTNNYTGKTTVSGGTLLVNGLHSDDSVVASGGGYGSTGTGHFEAGNGTTIGGSGRIKGQTSQNNSNLLLATNGATVAPGSAAGVVGTFTLDGAGVDTTGSKILRMGTGSKFAFDLAGDGTSSDQINFWNFVTGDMLLNSNAINLTLSGSQVAGTYTVSLFKFYSDAGTTPTSSFITSGLTTNGIIGAGITNISLNYNSGGSSIDLTYEVVPEPSTLALLGLTGIAAIAYRIRRNRRS